MASDTLRPHGASCGQTRPVLGQWWPQPTGVGRSVSPTWTGPGVASTGLVLSRVFPSNTGIVRTALPRALGAVPANCWT